MDLQTYVFEESELRMVEKNNEPWFVGKDVAEVLGYSNSRKALSDHVDKEDKGGVTIRDAIGRTQRVTCINESGLYSLILKSKLPKAKQFKRWVTNEVLPSIRKHGMYATTETIDQLLNDPDTAIKLLETIKSEREQRLIAEQQVKELQPKADYYDSILKNKSLVSITVIAKNYGMSGKGMNNLLRELGIQYKQGKTWLLYSKYQDKGFTHTEMIPVQGSKNLKPNTKWTQKGHIFIYQLLKDNGILPTIEREERTRWKAYNRNSGEADRCLNHTPSRMTKTD